MNVRLGILRFFVLTFLVIQLFTTQAFALDPVYSNFLGKAIRGYDPVAYFKVGKAVEGSGEFQTIWKDAKWNFSSAENLQLFKSDPEKYAPQYGGYCAWAVSQGYTASTDPQAWTIEDGKLYLNYSQSVKKRWSVDIPGNIRKGDQNWPALLADE